jgi:ABC-type sugar transport system ATPase subunit
MIGARGLVKHYRSMLAVDNLSFDVYGDLRWPLREVGALLEAKAFYPGRTARAHLNALAASNAIGRQRVEEVLAITGIEKAADRRAGKFSLGMSQPARWKTRSSARSAPPGSAGTTPWGH